MAKRAKRWYRPRNVVLLLVALAVGWLGWGVYRAVTAKPGTPVDYGRKQHELVASMQPRSEGDPNAWDSLLAAVEILTGTQDRYRAAAFGDGEGAADATPASWPQGYGFPWDYSAVRDPAAPDAVVDPTLQVMDLLRDAGLHEKLAEVAARPRAVRPPPAEEGWLIGLLLPELGQTRNLARLCAARMYLAHAAGDEAEQVAAFEQMLALGRVTMSQATLIDRLVGIAVVSLALNELRSEMADEPLSPAVCRGVLAAMERQLRGIPPLSLQIDGERCFVLDAIQRTYTDDGHGSGRLLLSELHKLESGVSTQQPSGGIMSHPIVNVAGIFFPSRREVTAKTNEMYDGLKRYALASHGEREAMNFSFDAEIEALPRGYLLLKMLMPAFGKSVTSEDQFRVELEGTRLVLALRLYRIDHGEYPESLDALAPSLLASAPFDPVSGKPYGYRRLKPEEDPNGWGYIVYSFGRDGEDNGGVEHPKERYTAMRPDGNGYDFVINDAAPRGR